MRLTTSTSRPRATLRDTLLMAAALVVILAISFGVAFGLQKEKLSRRQPATRQESGAAGVSALDRSLPPPSAQPSSPPPPASVSNLGESSSELAQPPAAPRVRQRLPPLAIPSDDFEVQPLKLEPLRTNGHWNCLRSNLNPLVARQMITRASKSLHSGAHGDACGGPCRMCMCAL